MIEVFKTSVSKEDQAKQLASLLLRHFPGSKVNFDLEDCDNILRIEHELVPTEKVAHLLEAHGCHCEVLE